MRSLILAKFSKFLIPNTSVPTLAVNQQTIEKWLLSSAKAARSFLYPQIVVADSPLKEGGDDSLLDILPGDVQNCLLAQIIEQEETANLRNQQIQLNQVLQQAIITVDTES